MRPDTRLQGLYAITRQGYESTDRLLQETTAVLEGGAALLQYRDKSSDPQLRLQQASALADLCSHYDTVLIINDDIDLAKAVGAQGVHLGKEDEDIARARTTLGPDAVIGISCYNQLTLAGHAAAAGADYVAFGSFYPSPTKPGAVRAPIDLLEQWRESHIPACAIGGITLENAAPLINAGAAMLAAITDLWTAPDIASRAREYAALWC